MILTEAGGEAASYLLSVAVEQRTAGSIEMTIVNSEWRDQLRKQFMKIRIILLPLHFVSVYIKFTSCVTLFGNKTRSSSSTCRLISSQNSNIFMAFPHKMHGDSSPLCHDFHISANSLLQKSPGLWGRCSTHLFKTQHCASWFADTENVSGEKSTSVSNAVVSAMSFFTITFQTFEWPLISMKFKCNESFKKIIKCDIPEETSHFLQNYKQPIVRPDKFQHWSNAIFKL